MRPVRERFPDGTVRHGGGCVHHPGALVQKLEQVGPAGLEADLASPMTRCPAALGSAVRQNGHVLTPLHAPRVTGWQRPSPLDYSGTDRP
jgi:hypothetical protein